MEFIFVFLIFLMLVFLLTLCPLVRGIIIKWYIRLSEYAIVLFFAVQTAILLTVLPLKIIHNIINQGRNNLLLAIAFTVLVSCICIAIRKLFHYQNPSLKYIIALNIIIFFVLTVIPSSFDITYVLCFVHTCMLSHLELLGWEVPQLLAHSINLCAENSQDGGNAVGHTGNNTNVHNTLGMQLGSLSHTINRQFFILERAIPDFEEYFDRIGPCRARGDLGSASYYTSLARAEKSKMRTVLETLEHNIYNRSRLSMQGQTSFPDSNFSSFSELDPVDLARIDISKTLVYSPKYKV